MKNIMRGAKYRLAWAGLGLALAFLSFWEFSQERNSASLVTSAGWVLMSAAWFMQPTILRRGFHQSILASKEYVVGPAYLRYVSLVGGLVLLIVGLALKFGAA
jgi:hypothetical protein